MVATLGRAVLFLGGSLALGALQRRIERDNLLIRDRLDDLLGFGLRADQVGTFPAFVSRIGHTVPAFIDLPRQTSTLTILRIWTLSGTVPTPHNELTDSTAAGGSRSPRRIAAGRARRG